MKALKKLALSVLFATLATSSFGGEPLRYFGQNETAYHSQVPYGNNEKVGHYATASDGAKIYFERYGKGSPVIVLHGGLVGSTAEMGEFIDRLSQNHEVIAISTRGHGKSEVGSVAPTYAQKAADVLVVLKAAQINGKVDLLGFSDGAYTALTFAAAYPEQAAKIIAIGAGEWKRGFIQGGGNKRASYEQIRQLDPSYWDMQQSIRPNPQQTAAWFDNAQKNYDNTQVGKETFGKIQSPVLFVVGEDDANAPLDTVINAYRMTQHADLAVIPNAPHPVFVVNFPAVWTVVGPYLNNK